MQESTAKNMLERILAPFGRNLTAAMLGVCIETCSNYPDLFANYAVEQAGDLDKMPGNMKKFLRDSWFRWRETHPSMAAREQVYGCNFCHDGLIHYVVHRTGYGWDTGAAICGHCRPSGQTHGNIRKFGGEIVAPGEGLSLCVARNAKREVPAMGENFTAKLDAWKRGQRPYERATPDDDRQEDRYWQ